MTILLPVALLSGYLGVIIIFHRWGQRHAERRAKRRLPTQGIALKAVIVSLVLALVGLAVSYWFGKISLAWCVWGAVVITGIGYCYWLLVCITESARRYMIAELVSQTPGLTVAEIVKQYNRSQIILARLERLEHWGTLVKAGDYYKAPISLMLIASMLVRFWARLLGFTWPRNFNN